MLQRVTLKWVAVLALLVTKPVRVPEPVYQKLTRQAEREDVSRGVVVREWMEQAEEYEQMEARHR